MLRFLFKRKRQKPEMVPRAPVRRGEPVKEILHPSGKCKTVILRGSDGVFRLEVHVLDHDDYMKQDYWYQYDAGSYVDTLEHAEELAQEEMRRHAP
jgi:hypothetical protein